MLVVIGESLIDLIAQSAESGALLQPFPGGSPANTAIAAAAQGSKVCFLGQLSSDHWGDYLYDNLNKNGVDTSYLHRSAQPSSLAVVHHDGSGNNSYAFYVNGTADSQPPFAICHPQWRQVQALLFGSYSIALESFRSRVEPLLWQASSQGVLLSFDVNIRPSLLPERSVYLQHWHRWLDCCDLVKLSDEDLDWLFPGQPLSVLLDYCFAARPTLVMVSHGAGGATIYQKDGNSVTYSIPAPQLVDTVGAGDTLHGALWSFLLTKHWNSRQQLARLSSEQLSTALRWAVAAAALNCGKSGCQPPTADDVHQFIAAI